MVEEVKGGGMVVVAKADCEVTTKVVVVVFE